MSEYVPRIQWYPGHMAKTKRLLQDQLKRTDLILELCDARIPQASRNPDLGRLAPRKRRLLFLNKADLADPEETKRWVRHFREQGIEACPINASALRSADILRRIETAVSDLVDRSLEKGVRRTVRAMVVGIPNVGKSTFINRLCGKSVTVTGDRPGVTKSNQWVKVSPWLELLDTPGLLWPKLEDQESARRLCYIGSVKDEVVDQADLTIRLLEDLCASVPDRVTERFHFTDPSLRGAELLDAVCEGRGWLLKGRNYDYDRCCSIVLDEFRGGKLGRMTLERPPQKPRREAGDDLPTAVTEEEPKQ